MVGLFFNAEESFLGNGFSVRQNSVVWDFYCISFKVAKTASLWVLFAFVTGVNVRPHIWKHWMRAFKWCIACYCAIKPEGVRNDLKFQNFRGAKTFVHECMNEMHGKQSPPSLINRIIPTRKYDTKYEPPPQKICTATPLGKCLCWRSQT